MRNLFIYGGIILVIVFSLSSSWDYIIFLIAPVFLILVYDLTLGRKKYLTLIEIVDNELRNEKKIATTT